VLGRGLRVVADVQREHDPEHDDDRRDRERDTTGWGASHLYLFDLFERFAFGFGARCAVPPVTSVRGRRRRPRRERQDGAERHEPTAIHSHTISALMRTPRVMRFCASFADTNVRYTSSMTPVCTDGVPIPSVLFGYVEIVGE